MKNGFLTDFKNFAMRGNAIDLAVGVIVGGAFGKIVSSIVSDILMPVLGKILGGFNFSDLKVILTPEVKDAAGAVVTPEVALGYGIFIQNTIDFIIIAFSIFIFIRLAQRIIPKKEEAPAAPPAPSKEELLLTDIRDLLKKQSEK